MQLLTPGELQGEAALPGASRAVRWVAAMSEPQQLVRNVAASVRLLRHGALELPLTRCDGWQADHSYVVSPHNAYFSYAADEIPPLPLGLRPLLRHTLGFAAGALRARDFDRHVAVNNWLLSTNLYPPDWHGEDVPAITRELEQHFPDHALVWRSLNALTDGERLEALRAAGYLLIPSRRVFLVDLRQPTADLWRLRSLQRDRALRARGLWQVVPACDLRHEDFDRMAELYRLLYLEKYHRLNPDYTADWLRLGHAQGWLELTALRSAADPHGPLQGVVGWFRTDAVQSSPLLGYNTALPIELGLYRLLGLMSLEEAWRRGGWLNFSAGAPHWKQTRGARPVIEYSAVAIRHLTPARQWSWRLLNQVARRVAVPLAERYDL